MIRYNAPTSIATVDVSPITPAVVPRNILRTFTLSPLLSNARGVAPVTPSYVKLVILPANDISRKHLAASAGFMKFCPRPPKSCLTTIIAKTLPNITIQRGIVCGIFIPSKSPVTTALRSPTVIGLCMKYSKRYSETTHVITETTSTASALIPKLTIPKIHAGNNAIHTSSIMRLVDELSRTCGDDDTFNIFIISSPPYVPVP